MTDEPSNGTVQWRLKELENKVRDLEEKVDKLVLALITASLMITVSVAVFAITVIATGGRPGG